MEDQKDIFLKKLGDRIVALRKERNLSQSDLASLMDSEKPHIRKLEKGKRNATVSTLLKLSNALGVSVSELVDVGV